MRILPKLSKRPEVSVIMAVKNGEATLRSALDSMFDQTFTEWEVVIINDGSTDATSSILKEYEARDSLRVKILSQPNMGLTKSLNRAIGEARGDYIARLDADDVNLPHRLETQLRVIKKDKLDFVVSRAYKEGGVVPGNLVYATASANLLKFDNFFVHGSFFGKIEIFQQLRYDEKYRFAQDYDFISRLLKSSYTVGYIYDPLYVLGTGANQISVQKAHEQKELSKKIALSHHSSMILSFYWSLPAKSPLRKIMKLSLGAFSFDPNKLVKVFN